MGLEPAVFPLHPVLFRSKATARRNNSVRMFVRPRVRNLRNPKSFFSREKALRLNGASLTQMDASLGGNALFGPRTLLQEDFLQAKLFRLFWIFGAAASALRQGQPAHLSHRYQAVDTSCPSFSSVRSRYSGSFLPCVQMKQSSCVSYVMFSMRPICF